MPRRSPPSKSRIRALGVVLTLTTVVMAGGSPVARALTDLLDTDPPPTSDAPSGDVLPTRSRILPELGVVPVSGSRVARARGAVQTTWTRLGDTRRRHDEAVAEISRLRDEADDLQTRITRDDAVKREADDRVRQLSSRIRGLALRSYVGATRSDALVAALELDQEAALEAEKVAGLTAAVTDATVQDLEDEQAVSAAAGRRLAANRATLHAVEAEIAENVRIRDDATAEATRLERALVADQVELADARAIGMVEGTNIPLVALDAYVRGARLANERHPGCAMTWSLLAGIGQVESHQGTYGGARLDEHGQVSRPIYGMALDGTAGNERIEVDGGFMRAEGPMQFLPSTWAAVSVDGNGDGEHDIQNLYDAAASAANYLCRGGGSVAQDGGRAAAIRRYNNSARYVADVVAQQERYRSALPDLTDDPPRG